MVVYFFAIVALTKVTERLMMRYNAVYRDHLSWQQRRKLIAHAWKAPICLAAVIIQCIAYLPELFTAQPASPNDVKLLLGVSTIVVVGHMHDLAYTTPDASLVVHHLSTALALVLVAFSIDETNAVQTFIMFTNIMLMFESLSWSFHVAMVFHRLWGSPVPHPKLHYWAGVFMRAAAWKYVITRVFVYCFVVLRLVQVARLGPSELEVAPLGAGPFTPLSARWYYVWVVFLPVLLVAMLYAHHHTAVVMFALAKRYEKSEVLPLKSTVVAREDN